MGVLQRTRHRKAVSDRRAAIADLREATSRFGSAVARLGSATQAWSASQAVLARKAAADSEAVTSARHLGGSVTTTLAGAAGDAQDSVVSTAKAVHKRGLRVFDISVVVGMLVLRKRLQKTRSARQATQTPQP